MSSKDLSVKILDLNDLVIAPTIEPFSDYEPARTGEAALLHAIREWDLSGRKDFSTLAIYMPSDKMKSLDQTQSEKLLRHYFENQLSDIMINKSLFYRNAFRVFRNAFLFLTLCMAMVTVIGLETVLPKMPDLLRRVLVEGITVIGWVVMWRPVELMLNELGELKKADTVFHKLLKAKIAFIAD